MHSAMGVSIRYRKSDGGWVVRITHKGKRCEQGGFGHGPEGKARAEKYADEVRHANELADDWSNPFLGSPCPTERLCKGWLAVYGPLRSERTQITDGGRVNRLIDFFGSRDARTLTHADLVSFASHTMRKRSASLAIGCLSTLRRVLNLAVRDGHLERNPVPTLAEVIKACRDRGSDEEGTRDAWSHEEAETLLQLAWKYEPHFAPALQFALATGARRGEILALKWELVDFLQQRVEIRRTVNPSGKETRRSKRASAGSPRLRRRFPPCCSAFAAMNVVERTPTGFSRARRGSSGRSETSSEPGTGCGVEPRRLGCAPSRSTAPGTLSLRGLSRQGHLLSVSLSG
jgi:integrase